MNPLRMPFSLSELNLISAYLNAVATKVDGGTLSLEWLTGDPTHSITGLTPDGHHEETQCLSFGGTLWIANNGDNDSAVQQAFLNWAGISSPAALLAHAKNHGIMAMPFHAGRLRLTGNMTDEQTVLLAALRATGGMVSVNRFARTGTSSCARFNLGSNGTPARGAIIFVIGSYECDSNGGSSCHAEQKLLAASGFLHRTGTDVYVSSRVGGTKPPCRTCRTVLDSVQTNKMPGLQFDTTQGRQNVVGIKKLDVGHYFTSTGPDTELAKGLCGQCGVKEGVTQQYCASVPTHRVPVCYDRDCRNASSKLDWRCLAHR